VYFDNFLRLNYSLAYQQFLTPGNSTFTFQRLTADLSHQFVLYKKTTRNLMPRDNNPYGPDECPPSSDPRKHVCEAISRDREGTVGLRFYLAASMTPGCQSTLPGSGPPTTAISTASRSSLALRKPR